MHRYVIHTFRGARRVIIAIAGCTVVLIGAVMIVTPGPAFVVIPVGLGILGLEFAWARRLLKRVRKESGDAWGRISGKDRGVGSSSDPA